MATSTRLHRLETRKCVTGGFGHICSCRNDPSISLSSSSKLFPVLLQLRPDF